MSARALGAYGAVRAALDPREQEADVFRRVTGGLRAAGRDQEPGAIVLARALADNRRLWMAVEGALRDPTNALPPALRASIISLGRVVQREMDRAEPDLGFLIEINEQMAAGLAGQG